MYFSRKNAALSVTRPKASSCLCVSSRLCSCSFFSLDALLPTPPVTQMCLPWLLFSFQNLWRTQCQPARETGMSPEKDENSVSRRGWSKDDAVRGECEVHRRPSSKELSPLVTSAPPLTRQALASQLQGTCSSGQIHWRHQPSPKPDPFHPAETTLLSRTPESRRHLSLSQFPNWGLCPSQHIPNQLLLIASNTSI